MKWLGFEWGGHEYYASDYFDRLYQFAEALIKRGHAYVDSQSAEEIRATPRHPWSRMESSPRTGAAARRKISSCSGK